MVEVAVGDRGLVAREREPVAVDEPEELGAGEAADVAKAKAQKGTAKALPDKASKQAATASTTKAQTEGGATAASQSADVAKAKSEKGTPKVAKPDMKDPAVQKAQQKAATQ